MQHCGPLSRAVFDWGSIVRRSTLWLLLLSTQFGACMPKIEDSPAYQAACHGLPVRTLAERVKAQEDGLLVREDFKCVDKASFEAKQRADAAHAAANTPEAIAARAVEWRQMNARLMSEQAEHEAQQLAREQAQEARIQALKLRRLEANTATEAELAAVPAIGPEVAAQIVAARSNRPFSDWMDMAHRVTGLSAAQPAMDASLSGLVVQGGSLLGAEPSEAALKEVARKRAWGLD